MRFLVDAQLPPALARFLVAEGHAAEHVADLHMEKAADTELWDFALRESAIIVTKDEDFAQRRILAGGGPCVIWVRLPNTRRADLLLWFRTLLPDILSALQRGESLIEVITGD